MDTKPTIETVLERIDALRDEMRAEFANVRADIRDVRADIALLERKIGILNNELLTVKASIEILHAEVDTRILPKVG
jgi:chromosome segregation ATPase